MIMKHMKPNIFTVVWVIVFAVSSHSFAKERCVWVWGMGARVVLEQSQRLELWSFLAAPHGKPGDAISRLYLSLSPSLIQNHPQAVREFIADAHSRGVAVEYLTGNALWALTETNPKSGRPYNEPSLLETRVILRFNAAGMPWQRFDGIQQDTEPHTMREKVGHPYSWSDTADRGVIWKQYLESLKQWQAMVDTHNKEADDRLRFGVATPHFWDPAEGTPVDHRKVQDIVDYIAIMNYDSRNPVKQVASEFAYARRRRLEQSVCIGVETQEIPWKEPVKDSFNKTLYLPTASYYYTGKAAMGKDIQTLERRYGRLKSYIGISFHYYEDHENGVTAYRAMGLQKHNRAPACLIHYPTGQQSLSGVSPIYYTAYDPDGDALRVSASISKDMGRTWQPLPTTDSQGQPMKATEGVFYMDTSLLDATKTYLLKVEAQEVGGSGLVGFDVSDSPFKLVLRQEDLPVEDDDQDSLALNVPPATAGQPFTFTWAADADAARSTAGYFYSWHTPFQANQAFFTRGTTGSLVAPAAGKHALHVWPVSLEGELLSVTTRQAVVRNDLDKDGVPDRQDADADGDGVKNVDEKKASTDPLDSGDFPDSCLLGHWSFDGGQLTNHVAGGPKLITDKLAHRFVKTSQDNQALKLDGRTRLRVDGDLTAGPIHALTVEMWIKPQAKDRLTYIPLIFEGDIDGGLSLILKNDADFVNLRAYQPAKGRGVPGSVGMVSPGVYVGLNARNDGLFDGDWHHVAFTYNGYDKALNLYIDGQRVAKRYHRSVPKAVSSSMPLRFFDATSDWDNDNSDDTLVENSAQFESNAHPRPDLTKTGYIGLVDHIKVTQAALPPTKLGFWTDRVLQRPRVDR